MIFGSDRQTIPVFLDIKLNLLLIFRCEILARELNSQLESWLSKVSPSFRPAKAIIAP